MAWPVTNLLRNTSRREFAAGVSRTVVSAQTLAKIFGLMFVLTSIWPDTFAEDRATLAGRLAPSDLLGAVGAAFMLLGSRTVIVPRVFLAYCAYLAAILAGLSASLNPSRTLLHLLIHIFAGLMFVVLVTMFKDKRGLDQLILGVAGATLIASGLGILGQLGFVFGLPELFNGPYASSTFRNSGQAGTFIFTMLSVLIPVIISGYALSYSRFAKGLLYIASVIGTTFLVLTVKRAALAGFAVSLVLTVLSLYLPGRRFARSRVGLTMALALAGLIVTQAVQFVFEANPALADWYRYKLYQKTDVENISEGFIAQNWKNAYAAFLDHPIFGTGIGAIAGSSYGSHEVHSTYLKVLGETGLVGLAGYLVFLSSVVTTFLGIARKNNKYTYLVRAMVPFFVGNVVSWAYTYHVRKREFWIMLAVAIIAARLSRQEETERNETVKQVSRGGQGSLQQLENLAADIGSGISRESTNIRPK